MSWLISIIRGLVNRTLPAEDRATEITSTPPTVNLSVFFTGELWHLTTNSQDVDGFVDEWFVYGEFRHGDEKYDEVSEAVFMAAVWVSDDHVADDFLCQLYVAHQVTTYY